MRSSGELLAELRHFARGSVLAAIIVRFEDGTKFVQSNETDAEALMGLDSYRARGGQAIGVLVAKHEIGAREASLHGRVFKEFAATDWADGYLATVAASVEFTPTGFALKGSKRTAVSPIEAKLRDSKPGEWYSVGCFFDAPFAEGYKTLRAGRTVVLADAIADRKIGHFVFRGEAMQMTGTLLSQAVRSILRGADKPKVGFIVGRSVWGSTQDLLQDAETEPRGLLLKRAGIDFAQMAPGEMENFTTFVRGLGLRAEWTWTNPAN